MNSEMTDLARQAVACDGWRWMEGMKYYRRGASYRTDHGSVPPPADLEGESLPDLTDLATLGCLHDLACEVHGADTVEIRIQRTPKMSGMLHGNWAAMEYTSRRRKAGKFTAHHCAGREEIRAHALVAAMKAGGER